MVDVTPTAFLQHNFDPISKRIDGYGGAHVLMGLIAAGGEPHIYIVGNVHGNLKKEIYEALAYKLNEMASTPTTTSIASAGDGQFIQ